MPYVMKYGGGRYTSVAWYPTHAEAQKHCDQLIRNGQWSGMPPRVEADAPALVWNDRPKRTQCDGMSA
jgi:hypothetical protein